MTTYYVAMNGSDLNDGSAGSPWKTISHAVRSYQQTGLNPGDEVIVRPGTYREFGNVR